MRFLTRWRMHLYLPLSFVYQTSSSCRTSFIFQWCYKFSAGKKPAACVSNDLVDVRSYLLLWTSSSPPLWDSLLEAGGDTNDRQERPHSGVNTLFKKNMWKCTFDIPSGVSWDFITRNTFCLKVSTCDWFSVLWSSLWMNSHTYINTQCNVWILLQSRSLQVQWLWELPEIQERVCEQACTLQKTPGLASSSQPELNRHTCGEFKLFSSQFPQLTLSPSKTALPPVDF